MSTIDVVWQSAVGTLVTGAVTTTAAYLAHRKGWLAKPAAALAGWLTKNTAVISDDVVKAIAHEVAVEYSKLRPRPRTTVVAGDVPASTAGPGGAGSRSEPSS